MPIDLADYIRAAGDFSLLRSPSDLADDVVEEDAIADGAVTRAKQATDAQSPAHYTSAPAAVSGTSSAGTAGEYAAGDHRHILDPGFELPPRNLPETLQILEHEYQAGGLRLLTDGSIQIAGDLQSSALGVIDTGATWGPEVTRTQDTSLGADPWIQMRFRVTDFAALPAASALGDYRIATDASGDPDVPTPMGPIQTIVSRAAPTDDTSGAYHYAYAQVRISNWPAGDYVRLLRNQPSEWNTPVRPAQITGGVNGQFIQKTAGVTVWGDAPSGGGALNGSLSELTWSGNTTIPAATANQVEGNWGDLQTLALSAGDNIVWFDLLDNREPTSQIQGWAALDFQIRRTRSSVTSTVWETIDYKINPRGVTGGHAINIRLAAFVEDAQAGDTYTLRARIRTDNFGNLGTFTFDAADQHVYVLNMSASGGTGEQLIIPPGNTLAAGTVGLEQITEVLRARFDPEYRITFNSGLGEHLWRFGSPAQADSVENNNPDSSYEPLDPSPQLLPLPYDRSSQTAHTDFLGYVLDFGMTPERTGDPRFGAGGVVDNALPMAMPTLLNDQSVFLFAKYVPWGSGGEPIFSIWTNDAGTTSWTLWHNATTGRLHLAEADGTEYGSYTIPAGAGLRGRLVSVGFQLDKTATGWQFALQVNGVAVAMSNPGTNPSPGRVVYGFFPGTRFNGQIMVADAIKATNASLGIPAGATGSGNTGLINPFGIAISQYAAAAGEFEYGRAWSENLLDAPATIVTTNEPYITFNKSFDIDMMDELRLDIQAFSSERGSIHTYLDDELTTRTIATPNTTLVGTWGFAWTPGEQPSSWFRGGLSSSVSATTRYASYIRPIVNGRICTGVAFRNFINDGDTFIVRAAYVR